MKCLTWSLLQQTQKTDTGGHQTRTKEAFGLVLSHPQTLSWSFYVEGRWGCKERQDLVPPLSWSDSWHDTKSQKVLLVPVCEAEQTWLFPLGKPLRAYSTDDNSLRCQLRKQLRQRQGADESTPGVPFEGYFILTGAVFQPLGNRPVSLSSLEAAKEWRWDSQSRHHSQAVL